MPQPDVTQNLYKDPNGTVWTDNGGVMRDISGVDPNIAANLQTKSKGSFTGNTSGGTMDYNAFNNQIMGAWKNSLPYLETTSVDQQNTYAANPDNVTVSMNGNTRIIQKSNLADYQAAGWTASNYVAPQQATTSTFRPRADGEDMTAYLQAKQAAGNSGVTLGTAVPTNVAPAPVTGKLPRATVAAIPAIQPKPAGNYIKGYDTNNGGAAVWVEADKYYPGISLSPVSSGGITGTGMADKAKNIDLTKVTTGSGATGVSGTISQAAQTEMERVLLDIENAKKIKEATMTAEEKQAQGLSGELLKAIGGLEGKAAYEAQLRQQKLDPIEASINSLSTEMASLKGEKARLLAEQQGKPITMASIIGAQAQINAVMDSKIFATASMIDALNGNYTRAEKSIENAVKAKYGVIEETIAIKEAQLKALEPTLTGDAAVRAAALTREYERQKQAVTDQKSNETKIMNLMLKAREAKVTDSNALLKIANSKTLDEAMKAYASSVPVSTEDTTLLSPTEAASLGVPYGTTKGAAAKMGIYAKATLTGQDKVDTEIKLSKQVDASTLQARTVETQAANVKTGYDAALAALKNGTPLNVASQSIITSMNKILDPNSVVRESEYARTPEGQSWLNQLQGKVQQIQQGGAGLTAESLKEAVDVSQSLLTNWKASELNTIQRARTQADNYGLNLDNIITPAAKNLLVEADKSNLQSYYNSHPDEQKKINDMIKKEGLSDYEVLKVVGGGGGAAFNSPLSTGLNGSAVQKIAQVYPAGATGGQCTTFLHKVADFPYIGDGKLEKYASVDKYGQSATQWRQNVQVGDIVVSGDNVTYGHTFMVNEILPDGKVRVTESNYNGDEKVNNTRIVSIYDPKIYGAIRPQSLKV